MTDDNCASCSDTSCDGKTQRPGESQSELEQRRALLARMCQIDEKLVVLSGKGGVGKSTVAVNLATSLAMAGKHVGLLDIDVHGPSVPKLLGLGGAQVEAGANSLSPIKLGSPPGMLSVMSVAFLLPDNDDAVIWRGPAKHGVIRQFLTEVDWGALDYLVVDSPPGTGDEPLSVLQLIDGSRAIIVTTPQDVAIQDVRRSVMFCRRLSVPILGVIENMSGFVCPHCGGETDIFGATGGERMAADMEVPFLGSIPMGVEVVASGEVGQPLVRAQPHSTAAKAFGRIVRPLLEEKRSETPAERVLNDRIKIAVPVAQGTLALHFGHCEQFAVFEVDTEAKVIVAKTLLKPPPHEPGVLPRWLHEQQANVVIAGGMGARAQSLFEQNQIQVVIGAPAGQAEQIVRDFLSGRLETGENVCDH